MRRLRPTFLLRCVTLLASVALVAIVFALGNGHWWIGGFVFAVLLWFVGVEMSVLPWLLERVLLRRAARSRQPARSIWFVDLDAAQDRALAQFHDDTHDNPTVR